MFNFGIEGYQPHWLNGVSAIMAAHNHRLRSLVGRSLTSTWLVWDLDDDSWWSDGPILLDFEGEQVEINHQKFDDLSITWNSADRTRPIRWSDESDIPLAWRDNQPPELHALRNSTLQNVELLEWIEDEKDLAYGAVAASFTLTNGHLTIYNAMDENGIEFHPPTAKYRRHPLN